MLEYKYSAWGTQLSRTGELANTLGYANPFRYRGYIYDDETWMYWLRSRYYYPELHRFINADALLGNVGRVVAHNVFAYGSNTPTNISDPDGKKAIDIVKGIFSAVSAIVRAVQRVVDAVKNRTKKKTNDAIDLTERLTSAMESNYKYMSDYLEEKTKVYGAAIAYVMANLEFASKVRSGGDWDFKYSWNLDRNQVYLFNGIEITYQDPGNIHFGYAGSALHTLTDLRMFAGEYQIISGTSDMSYWKTCFDDPDDYAAITYGYLLKNGTYSTAFSSYSLNP